MDTWFINISIIVWSWIKGLHVERPISVIYFDVGSRLFLLYARSVKITSTYSGTFQTSSLLSSFKMLFLIVLALNWV